LHEYGRNRSVFLPQGGEPRIAVSEYDVRAKRQQFRDVDAQACNVGAGIAIIDADAATVGPTELRELLPKRGKSGLYLRIILGVSQEHTDPRHSSGLLRARRDRPCTRAAEQCDELAPFHRLTPGPTITDKYNRSGGVHR